MRKYHKKASKGKINYLNDDVIINIILGVLILPFGIYSIIRKYLVKNGQWSEEDLLILDLTVIIAGIVYDIVIIALGGEGLLNFVIGLFIFLIIGGAIAFATIGIYMEDKD